MSHCPFPAPDAPPVAANVDIRLATVILAAGQGVRMRSEKAKLLHLLDGIPLVRYPVRLGQQIGSGRIVVVVGHQAEEMKRVLRPGEVELAEQRERLGSGHAVLQTRSLLQGFGGEIVILSGDVPLLKASTVRELIRRHREERAALSFLSVVLPDPAGYGRVVRAPDTRVLRIVEDRDATPDEKAIREVNGGIYCADPAFLYPALGQVERENEQGEYYLTDLVEMASARSLGVVADRVAVPTELLGINTPEELARVESLLRAEQRKRGENP